MSFHSKKEDTEVVAFRLRKSQVDKLVEKITPGTGRVKSKSQAARAAVEYFLGADVSEVPATSN